MAPNTRNFLVGSAVVVVAGLCTGLVAFYGGATSGPEAVRAELSYLPADVSAVGFADVRDIMDSEFRQRLREVMPTGAEKDRLFEETGIDVERDIDTVLVGLSSGNTNTQPLAILRGRFDQSRIEALAMQHGARQEQYAGHAMLVGLAGPARDGVVGSDGSVPSLAFLSSDLLAVGDASALRRAIDVAASGADVASNPDMMRFIASVQGTGNAWLVGRADHLTSEARLPEQVRQQIDGIQWLSVSANVSRDVRGLVHAEAVDEQKAEQLRAVLAGALAAAKMFGEQDPRVASALSSVQASGSGRNIDLTFEVSSGLLDVFKPAPTPEVALPTPAP